MVVCLFETFYWEQELRMMFWKITHLRAASFYPLDVGVMGR